MAVDRERGISVFSAVMSFEHQGLAFNLLDPPGHQDFSEDTYRTLTAVDSAVMVLDAASSTLRAATPSTCWTRSSSLWRSTWPRPPGRSALRRDDLDQRREARKIRFIESQRRRSPCASMVATTLASRT